LNPCGLFRAFFNQKQEEERLKERVEKAHPEWKKKEVHEEVLRREKQVRESQSLQTPKQKSVSQPTMPRLMPSARAGVVSRVGSAYHMHGHDMPVIMPHLPEGRSYIPVRADGMLVGTFEAGHYGIVAPTFGVRYPICYHQGIGTLVTESGLTITKEMLMSDNVAATGGPLETIFGVQNGTWIGGISPYVTYGLADMDTTSGSEANQFGIPQGQLLGGFMEIEVATPWEGALRLSLIDDSDPVTGRTGATISSYEAANSEWAKLPTPSERDLTPLVNPGGVAGTYVPVLLTGLDHKKWVLPICPRHIGNVCLAQPAGTAYSAGLTTGSVTNGCLPAGNALSGIATSGAGVMAVNTSSVSIPFIVRVHFEFAVLPVQNSASATLASSYALLTGIMRQGQANPAAKAYTSAANPPGAKAVSAEVSPPLKKTPTVPPVLNPSNPAHKNIVDTVLSAATSALSLAERGVSVFSKFQAGLSTGEKIVEAIPFVEAIPM
jgi:hypothetical protein